MRIGKLISVDHGPKRDVEVRMPRDRNATFEPITVPKQEPRLEGLAGNVISL